jgi:hypothetical protein
MTFEFEPRQSAAFCIGVCVRYHRRRGLLWRSDVDAGISGLAFRADVSNASASSPQRHGLALRAAGLGSQLRKLSTPIQLPLHCPSASSHYIVVIERRNGRSQALAFRSSPLAYTLRTVVFTQPLARHCPRTRGRKPPNNVCVISVPVSHYFNLLSLLSPSQSSKLFNSTRSFSATHLFQCSDPQSITRRCEGLWL